MVRRARRRRSGRGGPAWAQRPGRPGTPPESGAGGVRGRLAAPSLGPLRAQQQGQGIRCRVSRCELTRAGLAAKDAQFSGASNEPGFRPIGARGAEPRGLQRAHCARNSRVGAYAAVFRAVSAHAPGLAAKDAQSSGASNEPGFRPIGARGAEPRVLQRARGDRARSPRARCKTRSALAATGPYWANTNFGCSSVCFRRMPNIPA
jgi:hypothetical protein